MTKAGLKLIGVTMLLAMSSCNNGGGGKGSSNNTVIPGVIPKVYDNMNQRCDVSTNTYTCTENGRSTGAISFDSLITMCSLLRDENRNGSIAYNSRQQIIREQCNNINVGNNGQCLNGGIPSNGICSNNGNNGGNPPIFNGGDTSNNTIRTFRCQLAIKKGDTFGDTGPMAIPVISGVSTNLFAYIVSQKKFLNLIPYQFMSTSERLGKVTLNYTASNGLNTDMIRLSADKVDGLSTSVTGFAGAETRLDINLDNESSVKTSVSVSCRSTENLNLVTTQYRRYSCKGTEKINSKVTKIAFSSPLNEEFFNESSYDVTQYVQLGFSGAYTNGNSSSAAVASYSIAKLPQADRRSVSTQAHAMAPTTLSVKKSGYALNVTCKPTL